MSILLNGANIKELKSDKLECKANMVSSGFQNVSLNKLDQINFRGSPDEHFSPAYNHLYSDIMNNCEKNTNSETQMQELMLIHLDLVQQQSEQLATKDKLINDLKNEIETLHQRLLRMERRVSLHKNSESSAISSPTAPSASTHADKHSGNRARWTGSGKDSGSLSPISKRGRRGTSAESRTSSKGRVPSRERGRSGSRNPVKTSAKTQHHKPRKRDRRPTSVTIKQEDGSEPKPLPVDDCLMTKELFYSTVGQPSPFALDPPSEPPSNMKANLEVPSWRFKVYSSIYSLEGTENLNDEVFEKRHQPKCIEERRRKRWDVQRLREQRNIEKLKKREKWRGDGREEGGGTSPGPPNAAEIDSFWFKVHPEVEITVKDVVPAGAFGITLPPPPPTPTPFTLPWIRTGSTRYSHSNSRGKR